MDSPSEFEPSEFEPSDSEGLPADHQHSRLPDPGRPRVVFTAGTGGTRQLNRAHPEPVSSSSTESPSRSRQ